MLPISTLPTTKAHLHERCEDLIELANQINILIAAEYMNQQMIIGRNMVNSLIQQWTKMYIDSDIREKLHGSDAIYDVLLVELVDCYRYSQALTVMNHCPVSQIAIKESLYVALAIWTERRNASYFIDTCIKRLKYLTPQNAPAFLTHIMIGGAYPYLLPALKLNFERGARDYTISKKVEYCPDLREHPECMWCDFVDWVNASKDDLGEQYYPGLIIDSDGIKFKNNVKRKYLRTRKMSKFSTANNWVATYLNLSTWKKKFNYFSTHSRDK